MATLKGQNFRILTFDGDDWKVIAMSTNCTVTLTNNTESSSHKDIGGNFAAPTVVSKGWSVQVESLNVTDLPSLLAEFAAGTLFTLAWDETSTRDNQDVLHASWSRTGTAYLTDFTANFNNRENSVKQLQFTGSGGISTGTVNTISEDTPAFTKGQTVRLYLSSDGTTSPSKVIGAATQLSFHCSVSLEDATTKDTAGEWIIQEPTEYSYDISTTALVRSGESISSLVLAQGLAELETIYNAGSPVLWAIANASGANNRTMGAGIVNGKAILTNLTMNAADRQKATYTAQLTGYKEFY